MKIFWILKMKLSTLLVKLIDLYQRYVSPLTKRSCVFYPTCSQYTKEAISRYGAIKGVRLGVLRIIRCHPWQENHIDPVP